MIMKKFRPKVVNGGFICSYYNRFFKAKADFGYVVVFNPDTGYREIEPSPYVYDRCPHCLHVLNYEIQEDLHLDG